MEQLKKHEMEDPSFLLKYCYVGYRSQSRCNYPHFFLVFQSLSRVSNFYYCLN